MQIAAAACYTKDTPAHRQAGGEICPYRRFILSGDLAPLTTLSARTISPKPCVTRWCRDRIRHAYLFSGPRGTGKTTNARLLAKAVNCLDPDPMQRPCNACEHCIAVNEGRFLDLIEIDAASHTGVDDVRDLRDKIAFAPNEGRYKVYIIDEVHRFSGAAFDALLKTLEEPPAHAIFVLATTEIAKVPATIKSRCLTFEFRRVPLAELVERLALIAEIGACLD